MKRGTKNNLPPLAFLIAVLCFSLSSLFVPTKIVSSTLPFQIYSNQTEQNLEKTVLDYINQAQTSIVVSTFGEVNSSVLDALEEKALKGVDVTLHYDAKTFPDFPKNPLNFKIVGHKVRGLMHQKILAIDGESLLLGSTNLTNSSFKMHDNLLLGLHSREVTEKIIDQLSHRDYLAVIEETFADAHFLFWSLPGLGKPALNDLIRAIDQAKESIDCLVFTFTHPKITQALSAAMRRGVSVTLTVDKKSVKGASKEAVETIRKLGATIYVNSHPGLMHHKMGWIDQEIFFFGSANWTKAAFEKNRDYLIRLDHLSPTFKKELSSLYRAVEKNRKPYRANQ